MKKTITSIIIATMALTFNACTDKCKDVTCVNGGTCEDGTCKCPEGFSGTKCEVKDKCFGVTCENGGTCDDGTCTCPEGYYGTNCENLTIGKLSGTWSISTTSNGQTNTDIATISTVNVNTFSITHFGDFPCTQDLKLTGKQVTMLSATTCTPVSITNFVGTVNDSYNSVAVTYTASNGLYTYDYTETWTKQ
jgi:hypothetical protein